MRVGGGKRTTMPDLEWKERLWGITGREAYECSVGRDSLMLRLEPLRDAEGYRVAVLSGRRSALYRSNSIFPLEEAKQAAVHAGIRVARKQVVVYTQIAELLAKYK